MAASVDLSTTYLGLPLANPFLVGASPFADSVDMARRLEDAGCAAIVMRSLFEEQITHAREGRIRHLDPLEPSFSEVLSYFPGAETYPLGPEEYLEQIARLKRAVHIPIIASLNGTTAEAWLKFAGDIATAGADALELNMYEVVTDPRQSGAAIEATLRTLVAELHHGVRLPIAVKLSPFFTALAHVAASLDHSGAAGLVLFNRFCQPDIDIDSLATVPTMTLSGSSELLLRLRWVAALRGHIRASIALSGGVATPVDGIKALLAGADVVQMVSAIVRHGPTHFEAMRRELMQWMETRRFASIGEVRGRVSLADVVDPNAFERASYLKTLGSWREATAVSTKMPAAS